MDCKQVQELLEAYVLDALDRDEHDAVTAHLAQCANCQRLLAEYQTILVSLPVGLAVAAPAYPPAALKDRILQAIDSPSVDQSAPVAISSANGSAVNVSATSRPGRASARRNRRRILLPLAAAILVLALLALGTGLSVALAREQALRAALANLTGQQELVLDVVDSSKMSKIVLRAPAGSNSTSYGKLYTRPDLPNVVAMAARLPQPLPGQAYHLWIHQQGKVQLAGVLTINDQGFGLITFTADHSGPTYESVEITLQPVGSTAPVEPAVLTGTPTN